LQLSRTRLAGTQIPGTSRPRSDRSQIYGMLAVFAAAVLLWWLCAAHPAELPEWAPWEFSWTQFLAALLALFWYARGVALTVPAERPALWRQGAFGAGVLLLYAVLLTHFEYMAQHMFFLNRAQHLVMHHLGPFLIALSWPGTPLLRGMPAGLRRLLESRAVGRVMRVVQQPVLAGLLFVGLIYLWLIPAVHFRAMIDPQLYTVMNWSMVIDGLLFWSLTLDPRPAPAARTSYAIRMIVTVLVMFPQILLGASITFSTTNLYPYYDLCGRLYPTIGAILDQHLGGTILWIPSAMMSSVAFMVILTHVRLEEERIPVKTEGDDDDEAVGRITILSSAWTGR
jgi:putative membrane protein